jgi:hypothetical protein
MSFSVACTPLRPGVVGSAAVRAGTEPRQPTLPPLPARGHPLAADGRVLAGRGRGAVPRTVRRQARLFRTVLLALPRPPHRGALVDRARAGARLSGRSRDRFFDHHGMLGFGRFRWRTVTGGSRRYVGALLARLRGRAHIGLGARAIRRSGNGVELTTDDGETRRFDRAVVATHADQALTILADASPAERSALGAFRYTANETVLHTDERFLPRVRAARASWNYQVNGALEPTVTYYLNRLQRLDADEHYCFTLNRTAEIDRERVIMRTVYDHPCTRWTRCAPSRRSPRSTASGTRSTPARTSATASTRTGSPRLSAPRRTWGWSGEVGALHRHARPLAPHPGAEHLPLPDLVLRPRPRRAPAARAAPRAPLGQPAEPRHVFATGTTSTARAR